MATPARIHRHKRGGFSGQVCSVSSGQEWWVGSRAVERFRSGETPVIAEPTPDPTDKGRFFDVVGLGRDESMMVSVSLRAGRIDRRPAQRSAMLLLEHDDGTTRELDLAPALGVSPKHLTGLLVRPGSSLFIGGNAGNTHLYECNHGDMKLRQLGAVPRSVSLRAQVVENATGRWRVGWGVTRLIPDGSHETTMHDNGPSDSFAGATKALLIADGEAQIWILDEEPKLESTFSPKLFAHHAAAHPNGEYFALAKGKNFEVYDGAGTFVFGKQPRGGQIERIAFNALGHLLVVTWKFSDVYEW